MKRLLILMIAALMLTGCKIDTKNNHQSSGLNRMQDPTEEVTYKGPSKDIKQHEASDAADGQFGFVHYSRKQGGEYALTSEHIPEVDYKALADIISRQALALPDIYDAATLVTDEYVLIGYKTTNQNREEAATQVRQSAFAVIPNYYHVVVSDADNISADIARYKEFNANTTGVHDWLQNMIERMQKSPQGHIKEKDTEKDNQNENQTNQS